MTQSLSLILLVQGILLLQPTTTSLEKKTGLRVHQWLQFFGVVGICCGTGVIWYNKVCRESFLDDRS